MGGAWLPEGTGSNLTGQATPNKKNNERKRNGKVQWYQANRCRGFVGDKILEQLEAAPGIAKGLYGGAEKRKVGGEGGAI